MNDAVKSAARTLDVLEFFAFLDVPVALHEISLALAIPKSSTLMLLRTLSARGYLSRTAGDLYCLNPALRRGDGSWFGGMHGLLVASAHPVMVSLADEVQETVLLGTLTNARMTRIVAKILSPGDPRFDLDSKVARPAYCTALGRVFLAHLPDQQIDSYLASGKFQRLTATTETKPERLRKILANVKEAGFAEIDQEYVVGGSGVAAPVFGPDGHVIAALNVAAVTPRYTLSRPRLIAAVVRAAADISAIIGKRLGSRHPVESSSARSRGSKIAGAVSPASG